MINQEATCFKALRRMLNKYAIMYLKAETEELENEIIDYIANLMEIHYNFGLEDQHALQRS